MFNKNYFICDASFSVDVVHLLVRYLCGNKKAKLSLVCLLWNCEGRICLTKLCSVLLLWNKICQLKPTIAA